MSDDGRYYFSGKDAARIAQVVKIVERRPRVGLEPTRRLVGARGGPAQDGPIGINTGGTIAAGSLSAPSPGTITVWVQNDGGPAFAASTTTVDVSHTWPSPVPLDAQVWTRVINGITYVAQWSCGG